jgi:hypothetical protein
MAGTWVKVCLPSLRLPPPILSLTYSSVELAPASAASLETFLMFESDLSLVLVRGRICLFLEWSFASHL